MLGVAVVTLGGCLSAPTSGDDANGTDAGSACVSWLTMGSSHGCAGAGDEITCWGDNTFGQLGTGDEQTGLAPRAATELPSGGVVEPGGYHTCAVIDGALSCLGADYAGQLGDPQAGGQTSAVTVDLASVAQVSAGDEHTCATTFEGEVDCWGSNASGQLGPQGDIPQSESPVVIPLPSLASAVAAGLSHTCALTADGVFCWGANGSGELGTDSVESSMTPLEVALPEVHELGVGVAFSCAHMADGTVKCWGDNNDGELGDGQGGGGVTRATPDLVTGLANIVQLSVGYQHACALEGNRVLCWGLNTFGQAVPDGPSIITAPTKAMDGIVAIAAGRQHTCALAADGIVHCWGRNNVGQLGNGDPVDGPDQSALDLCR